MTTQAIAQSTSPFTVRNLTCQAWSFGLANLWIGSFVALGLR